MIIEHQGELLQPKTLAPRIFNFLKKYVSELMPHQKVVILSFNDYLLKHFVPMSQDRYRYGEKLPSHFIVPCVRFIVTKKFHLLGSLFFNEEYFTKDSEKFGRDIAECMKLYILALENINLKVIATVCPSTTVFHRSISILTKVPFLPKHDGPLIYSVGKTKDIVHIHEPIYVRDSFLRWFLLFDLDFVLNGKLFEASRYDIVEVIELGEVPPFLLRPSSNTKYYQYVSYHYINEEVSSSIRKLIKQKYLSAECIGTSIFINMFRQLFHRIYGLNRETCEMFNFSRMNEYIEFIKSIHPSPSQFGENEQEFMQDTAASLPPTLRPPKSKLDLNAFHEFVQDMPAYSSIYPQEQQLLASIEQDYQPILISTESGEAFVTENTEKANSKTKKKNKKERKKERNKKPKVTNDKTSQVETNLEKQAETSTPLMDHDHSKTTGKKGCETNKKTPEISKEGEGNSDRKDVKNVQNKNLNDNIRQYKNSNKNISNAVRKIDLDNECNKENITENIIPKKPNNEDVEIEEMEWQTTGQVKEILPSQPDESLANEFINNVLNEMEQTLQIRDEMFARQAVATVFENYFSKEQIKNLMKIDPILENSPKFDSFVKFLKERNTQYLEMLSKNKEEKDLGENQIIQDESPAPTDESKSKPEELKNEKCRVVGVKLISDAVKKDKDDVADGSPPNSQKFGGAKVVGCIPKTTAFVTDVFGNRYDLPELSVPQSVLNDDDSVQENTLKSNPTSLDSNKILQKTTPQTTEGPEKVNSNNSDSSIRDPVTKLQIDNCSKQLENLNLTHKEPDGGTSSNVPEKAKSYQIKIENAKAESKKPTYCRPTSTKHFVDYSQEDTRYLQGGFSSGSEGDFEYQLYEDAKEDTTNTNSNLLNDPSDFNSEFDDYDDLILSKHVKVIINRLEEKDEEIFKKIEKKNSSTDPAPGPDKSQETKRGYVKKEIGPTDETGEKRTIFHRTKTEEPAAVPTNVIKNSENNCDKSKIDSTKELYKETLGVKSNKQLAKVKDEQYKKVAAAISQTIQKFANIFNLTESDEENEIISNASLEFVYNLKEVSSTTDDIKKRELSNYAYDKLCLSVLGRKNVVDVTAQDKMMELIPILHEIASSDDNSADRILAQHVNKTITSSESEEKIPPPLEAVYIRDECKNLWINNIRGIEIVFRRLSAEGICQGIKADIFKTDHVENVIGHIQTHGCSPDTLPPYEQCTPIDTFECFETLKPFGSTILVEDL